MRMQDTRVTLLRRLKENDHEMDWLEFYSMYDKAILAYARKLGLNYDGAYDVLQETMVSLVRILKNFEYDASRGKFRNFLLTIVHRSCLKAFRREAKRREIHASGSGSESTPWIERFPDASDGELDEDTHIWRQALFEQAMANVAEDLAAKKETVEIFAAYVLQGESAKEVAKQFGIKENAVYQIKNRMIDRLQAEVQLLIDEVPNG